MKQAIRMCTLAGSLALVAAPTSAVAQSGTILAEVLEDWSGLKESILELANYMPPDKYSYKLALPVQAAGRAVDSAQQHFGKRVLDIALVNVRFLRTLGGRATAPVIDDTDAMTSKEASIKAVAASFDYGIALLKEQTDQTMWQKVNALSLGPSSRVRVFRYLHSHARDVDGQLVIYLRLSGEVLPAIAG